MSYQQYLFFPGYPLLEGGVRALVVLGVLLQIVPLLVYFERKVSAWIQDRIGPNRVGPVGLLQPVADVIKLFLKEDVRPDGANKFMYIAAPALVAIPAMLAFAVIPVGYGLQIADLHIGIIYLLTVGSLGVYGLAVGGWASNNKYALLGGLRASAQMVSYEIALGLSILPVIMTASSVHLQDIVMDQTHGLWDGVSPWLSWLNWNVFRHPVIAVVFVAAAFAETNRLPFDLPESESELVGGYHTEYSGMKFGLFFLGEYVAMMVMSGLTVTLFLGGWTLPGVAVPDDPSGWFILGSVAIFLAKFTGMIFLFLVTRWTLPRFRYDQLMNLGWKLLIPLTLIWILLTAIWMVAGHDRLEAIMR